MSESLHNVSMVDLKRGYTAYRAELDDAVTRVLNSGWYILGSECGAFEAAFSKWLGVKHAIGVANGTDAIVVALKALGIEHGDGVLTVSHTAVATVAAIEQTGAIPVLVDIDPNTYTLDPEKLEAAVKEFKQSGRAGRLKAVIAVHLYGHPCDIAAIQSVCNRYDLLLIEDCAQAHGATLDGRRVGTFGDMAAFSFYPTKNLGAFGDGGAIATNDPALARRCRALRQYGWFRHYYSDIAGQNSRLDEMQAAILAVKLGHLDVEIARRRAVAAQYNDALKSLVGVPAVRLQTEHAYHLYVVRLPSGVARDDIMAGLKARGIATAIHYPAPVHLQKAYAGRVPLAGNGLNVTERAAAEILSLPMHPFLSDKDVSVVVDALSVALR